MQSHQYRVIDEKTLLDDKIMKLSSFMKGEVVLTLPNDEQKRMSRQLEVMEMYSAILGERIEAF